MVYYIGFSITDIDLRMLILYFVVVKKPQNEALESTVNEYFIMEIRLVDPW